MPEAAAHQTATQSPILDALTEFYTDNALHAKQHFDSAEQAHGTHDFELEKTHRVQGETYARRAAAANLVVLTYNIAASAAHGDAERANAAGRDAVIELFRRLGKTGSGNPLSRLSADEKKNLTWTLDQEMPSDGHAVQNFDKAISRRGAVRKLAGTSAALLAGAGILFNKASEGYTEGKSIAPSPENVKQLRQLHAKEGALLDNPEAWNAANVDKSLHEMEGLGRAKMEIADKIRNVRASTYESWFGGGLLTAAGGVATLLTALQNVSTRDKETIAELKPQLAEIIDAIAEMSRTLPLQSTRPALGQVSR